MAHVGAYVHTKNTFLQKINHTYHTQSPQCRPLLSANFGGLWPSLCTPLLLTKTAHINIH